MAHRYQVDPQRAVSALRGLVDYIANQETAYEPATLSFIVELDIWDMALNVLKEADQLAKFEQTRQDNGGEG